MGELGSLEPGIVSGPFNLAVLAAGAGALGSYLLPPSAKDLAIVVEHAAVAHAPGPALDEERCQELAGGWYAVLDGGWRRGARPYWTWGWLIVGLLGGAAIFALGQLSSWRV